MVEIGHRATAAPGAPDQSSAPVGDRGDPRRGRRRVQWCGCGVVTNPVAKNVLYRSGFAEPGHTEFLGKLATEVTGIAARARS